jgi:hypothetical protein
VADYKSINVVILTFYQLNRLSLINSDIIWLCCCKGLLELQMEKQWLLKPPLNENLTFVSYPMVIFKATYE